MVTLRWPTILHIVTLGWPTVTIRWPIVTLHTSPYLHLPHLASVWPSLKANETCGGWWWVVVATNFNVSSRQGFKLWGLSPWLPSLADPCLTLAWASQQLSTKPSPTADLVKLKSLKLSMQTSGDNLLKVEMPIAPVDSKYVKELLCDFDKAPLFLQHHQTSLTCLDSTLAAAEPSVNKTNKTNFLHIANLEILGNCRGLGTSCRASCRHRHNAQRIQQCHHQHWARWDGGRGESWNSYFIIQMLELEV